MSIGLNKEDINFLKQLQHEMLTQDTVGQAAPRFWVVQGIEKEFGNDVFSDGTAIIIGEIIIETIDDAFEYLSSYYDDFKAEYDGKCITYKNYNMKNLNDVYKLFQDEFEEASFISYKNVPKIYGNTMFLTNKSCNEHIKNNSHHYSVDAHSYAMTAWRSPEVAKLFDILDKINWDEVSKLI